MNFLKKLEHLVQAGPVIDIKTGKELKKFPKAKPKVSPMKSEEIDWLAPAKVKASTISVLTDLTSCGVYVEITNAGGKKESSNLTLRFDKGAAASLRGYPHSWAVHDLPLHDHDPEGITFQDEAEEGFMPDHITVYVSAKTEQEIYKQLKASLMKQFKDPMFKNHLSAKDQKKALAMLDKAM